MVYKRTINRTVEIMLSMFGVWPGIPLFLAIFWIIVLTVNEILLYWYFVTHFYFQNLFNLMDCLSVFLAAIKVSAKLITFSLKQRKFFEILRMMAEDWKDCDNIGSELRETTSKAKISSHICNSIIILHTIATFAYIVGILLQSADADITDRTTELPLVMRMEYPFVIDTPRKYKLVLATQSAFVVMCSWGAGLFNALFLALTLHVGGQMNILLRWLTEVGYNNIDKTQGSVVTIMTKIIQKHQKIICLSENIENLYSYITLTLFVSNLMMMCSLGFLIVTAIGSPHAVKLIARSLLFYAVTSVEAFIFCFAGEYLSNKSEAIGNAAYNSAWYNMTTKHNRVLLFIIVRAQKQLKLTAGKMADLSLEFFTNIMKASGSYLSVLLTMR